MWDVYQIGLEAKSRRFYACSYTLVLYWSNISDSGVACSRNLVNGYQTWGIESIEYVRIRK